uniref:Uncharacterized protein n=1 Tax=Trichobilharzia regenti TaxID=157069 RepID=A0AA85J460_TRIRE
MNTLVILVLLVQLGTGKESDLTPDQQTLLERHNFFRQLLSKGQVKGQPNSTVPLRNL